MDMQYGNGCVATSPTLSITTDPHCPCEDVTAGVISKKCFTRGCILMYGMTIEICNDGGNPVTFNQITANGNSSIASVATLPVTVPAHDCRTIYVEVKVKYGFNIIGELKRFKELCIKEIEKQTTMNVVNMRIIAKKISLMDLPDIEDFTNSID